MDIHLMKFYGEDHFTGLVVNNGISNTIVLEILCTVYH